MSDGPSQPDLRVVQANERTLLAWVRTSLGIMALGFAIVRVGLGVSGAELGARPGGAGLATGVTLILVASAMLITSSVRFARVHAGLQRGEVHTPGKGAGIALATALAVGGVAVALYLLFG